MTTAELWDRLFASLSAAKLGADIHSEARIMEAETCARILQDCTIPLVEPPTE
jgi:hypothetical protein